MLNEMRQLVEDCGRLVKRVEQLIEQDVQDDMFFMMVKVPKVMVQEDLRKMRVK